jgi:glycosyltransferase involved in cell wall biosynthesis
MISEAQGCGRPVIAVSHSGVEDLVEDGIPGRIVNREPAALSSAVDSLIADPETAHRLGKAAAFTVEGRRLEPIGRSLARFLEAVLSRKQLH